MLRLIISTLTACALAGVITVLAQEPAPPPQPEQQAPPSATLTGCVMEAKTTDGGTAYVLNKAQGGSAAMYVLAGAPANELASNVSKKVEVTGQVQEPNPPPTDDAKVLRPPIVQVESMKTVSENCD